MTTAHTTEGTIPFHVDGSVCQTWYRVFGDISDRTRTPLVTLHGGPGLAHDYLTPLADLATQASIPVIVYDQIGGGRSTYFPEKPLSFWTIDLFIDELVNLLKYFGIEDNFDLLGHSWGGQMGAEFEIRRQPAGLRRLILTNSLASTKMWGESVKQLLAEMPQWVRDGMAAGWANPKVLGPAMFEFQAKHGCTVQPPPIEFWGPLKRVFSDDYTPTVERAMFSQELKDWSILDKLHLIRQPTLVLHGRADVAQDFIVRPFFEKIPKVKWRTFELSSHTPMLEERESYIKEVLAFLE
ncbi:uncharacterized protein FIBRA_08812 [Fibroporia radiculosa]|uniref:AB hydrolase-1 domain-containing protein n=1 Tax=Fibroporia radiculosa TaxID=599839 RepID=J4GIA6_9APHY|nr:uncharacterized protein FIBRA_08812 [Fibroporia radiculosa]CCM06538.1 predicted protein [Fibroporia radiculosa]